MNHHLIMHIHSTCFYYVSVVNDQFITKVRIEGPGIDVIKFKVPQHSGWERKYIKHNKTFSDNTLEEQKD